MSDTTEDITNPTEPELSQVLLNSIINSTSDMIWSVNPRDFGLVTFNHGLYGYFLDKRGITIQVGMRPEDLFPIDEFVQIWRSFYQQALKEGSCIHEYQTSSGTDTLLLNINVLKREGEVMGLSVFGKNITERKRVEEALRAISNRQQVLLSAIPDIVMEVDNNKIYTWANQPGLEFFGEDVIGHEAAFYFEGEQDTYEIVKPLFGGADNIIYIESWQRRRDGQKRLLAWWCHVLKDENGNAKGALSSARDITGQKQAEIALIEERNLLVTLMDTIPDTIYFKDVQSRFIRVNQAHARRLGMNDPAQMIGKTDFDFFREEHARAAYEDEQAIIRTGQPLVDKEEEETFPDGHASWVSTTKMAWRDQQGQIVGTFGISRDITERIKAEEALHESEEKFRNLFNNAQVGMFRTRLDGSEVLDMNERFLTILGRTRAEMQGSASVLHWADPHEREEMVRQLAAGDHVTDFECGMLNKQGEVRRCLMSLRLYKEQGILEGSILDITERKHNELIQNAIYRITQAAIASDGIDALYHSIHAILGELIPAENFFIALYDSANGLISFPYCIDQYDEPPSAPIPVQGLTGYVIRTGRPLLATREVFDKLVQQGEVEVVGTVSIDWLGAPLKVEGRMIGVMAVQSYTPGIHFNQQDMDLLEFVSTQVAQAIERKRLEEEIRSLSLTDELTGLYNRRGFTLLAEQEVKLAQRIKKAMLLFFGDVDNLKTINDTLGHAHGDLALKEVSAILKKAFRESDILARIGGDEFVALALDACKESGEIITNRLQAALEARSPQGDETYHLSLSLGVAHYDPEAPCSLSELIAQADGLMYHQKQARKGKNSAVPI